MKTTKCDASGVRQKECMVSLSYTTGWNIIHKQRTQQLTAPNRHISCPFSTSVKTTSSPTQVKIFCPFESTATGPPVCRGFISRYFSNLDASRQRHSQSGTRESSYAVFRVGIGEAAQRSDEGTRNFQPLLIIARIHYGIVKSTINIDTKSQIYLRKFHSRRRRRSKCR